MRYWHAPSLAAVAALVLGACGTGDSVAHGERLARPATESSAHASTPARPDERTTCPTASRTAAPIFFVSERDGYPQPYALRGDGPPQRLSLGRQPSFVAPLGTDALPLLLVESTQVGETHHEWLATIPAGAAPAPAARPFGPSARHLRNPHGSPDGRSVVFEADLHSFRDIYRLELESGHLERLTTSDAGSFEPRLSPDGGRMVFTSSRDGNAEIYLLNLQSRHLQRLTWSPEDDAHPRWSPDGRSLVFVRSRRGRTRVFTMAANGAHPRPLRLTERHQGSHQGNERNPVFSPDGRFVALVEQLPGHASVRVVRASDGIEIGHSEGSHIDQQPAWSPDGRQLVFVSNRSGNDELFTMDRAGGCLLQLTDSPAADWLPRWARPTGSS